MKGACIKAFFVETKQTKMKKQTNKKTSRVLGTPSYMVLRSRGFP